MANIKTAISLQKSLFEKAEALARQLEISRSRLFALAVEEFIQRRHDQELLKAIDAAYEDLPDPEEQKLRRLRRQKHRKLVKGEW